jgi:hypothetical protein
MMQPTPKEPLARLIKLLYAVLAISLFVLAFYAWENFARSPEAEVKRQLCLYKRVCGNTLQAVRIAPWQARRRGRD